MFKEQSYKISQLNSPHRLQRSGWNPVRILLLSFHFPPQAPMSATRAPKLAAHLLARGHDVRVLCADDPQATATHPLEIDPDRVTRTAWRDRRAAPEQALARVMGGGRELSRPPVAPGQASTEPPHKSALTRWIRGSLRQVWQHAACRPDRFIGWRAPAVAAAERITDQWRPDVIYATAPPHTVAVTAADIATRLGVPWIAEFRDRWAEDAYADWPQWRRRLEIRHEYKVLSTASALVTVSPVWLESYRARYPNTPVHLAMNGYPAESFPENRPDVPPSNPDELTLFYAGVLYPGRRDPEPVLRAMAQVNAEGNGKIRLDMFGAHLDAARDSAERLSLGDAVNIHAAIPHSDIISKLYAADIALLLQWSDPRDAGTLPGKLFEYLAARRPILATGWPGGAAAHLIRDRGAGLLANDPDAIAAWLRDKLSEKQHLGRVSDLPVSARIGLSRAEQFAHVEQVLADVAPLCSAGTQTAA